MGGIAACSRQAFRRLSGVPPPLAQVFCAESDAFSFGVTMWALAHGARPWPTLSCLDAAKMHCTHRKRLPPPVRPGDALEDSGLRRIMEQCWRHEPSERSAMAQVVVQLQQWLRRADKFDQIDTNHDGVISSEEEFDAVDTNHDGVLSAEEYRAKSKVTAVIERKKSDLEEAKKAVGDAHRPLRDSTGRLLR